jgi:hypothetical protein
LIVFRAPLRSSSFLDMIMIVGLAVGVDLPTMYKDSVTRSVPGLEAK